MVGLRERRFLLLLDNFEHVVAAAPELARLLEACPGLTALVTSRAPLRLNGERQFRTMSLTLPDPEERLAIDTLSGFGAIALFVDRARDVRDDFRLAADNADAIVEICRRLDGLPLAIELAAAWVRLLPPALLLQRLTPRLPLLRGGGDDRPARLRTMHDAIAWSYDLLADDEARMLRRLAVFVDGFTLEAAERIGGMRGAAAARPEGVARSTSEHASSPFDPLERSDPPLPPSTPSVLNLIASLFDKSLLHAAPGDPSEPRYRMLETVREFALQRLAESGEEATTRAVHATYLVDLAERAEPHLLGPAERDWELRIEAELGNVRAALAWSLANDVETALRIAAPLWVYWSVSHLSEGRRWLQAALATADPVDESLRARALTTAGALACLLGDFAAGERSASIAAALAETTGESLIEARARWTSAANRLSAGQLEGVASELERALSLFAQATTPADRTRAAYARWIQGVAAFMDGEMAQGVACCERALAEVRAAGSDGVLSIILCDFAGWLLTLGESARAHRMFTEALALAADYPGRLLAPVATVGLALVAAMDGTPAQVARYLGATDALLLRSGLILPAHIQERTELVVAAARKSLGEEPFAAAWEEGRADPDAVTAAALAHGHSAPAATAADETAHESELTTREREILRLLVLGCADKEIAATLGLGRRTVSNHVAAIRVKLGVSSRTAAVAAAVRDRLV